MAETGASPHWEKVWSDGDGLQPGTAFDNSEASPSLCWLLENGHMLRKESYSDEAIVLIPGGGRGYDATAIAAKLGCPLKTIITLDLSETCCQRASEYLSAKRESEMFARQTERSTNPEDPTNNADLSHNDDKIQVACGNFFTNEYLEKAGLDVSAIERREGIFDLVWDCTFLCALHPDARDQWAKRYAEIMRPQHGELWTLIFPIFPDQLGAGLALRTEPGSGPPYCLNFELVESYLKPLGFQCTAKFEDGSFPRHMQNRKNLVPRMQNVGSMLCCWKLQS